MEIKTEKYLGQLKGISNEEYHSSPGVSKSGISKLLRSPAHYYAAYLDPEREPFKETASMATGTLAHSLVLEPEMFELEYGIIPLSVAGLNKNTKAYKEAKQEIEEQGLKPLHPAQIEEAKGIADSVLGHSRAGDLFKNGVAENSFYWIDEDTGVLCKCRPDYFVEGLWIPDLKTTTDSRQSKFSKSCADYDYHIQAAFYADGVEAVSGENLPMPFVAVETSKPYAVNVFLIDDDDILKARDKYKRALEIYRNCLDSGVWPAYPPEVKTISLPKWAD